jgi:hypothetical protein
METISSDLRTTAPTTRPKNVRRRDADPVRVFVDKDRLARFWFLAALAVLIGAAVERIHLARTLKERERVVIVDPGSARSTRATEHARGCRVSGAKPERLRSP